MILLPQQSNSCCISYYFTIFKKLNKQASAQSVFKLQFTLVKINNPGIDDEYED